MRQITPDTVNEFISQLVQFRKQERWIISEYRRVLKAIGQGRASREQQTHMKELSTRARQWVREYQAFLGRWAK